MPYEPRKFGVATLFVSILALAGCGSSGGSVGTGPGGGGPTPDPIVDPTGPIESRIAATYSGNIGATFRDAAPDGDVTTVAGRLTLDIDTDRATQIAASATGFTGTETSGGRTDNFALDGTLTGDGSVDMVAGSVDFGLAGRVNLAGNPSEGADVALTGTGTFRGADSEQINGTVAGTISGVSEEGAWEDAGTGEFLLILQ